MEKKLYRISNSKEPTLDQLRRMTSNLQQVFRCYVTIQIRVWNHSSGKGTEVEYWFGTGSDAFESGYIKSWPEVLATYRRLMKEAKSV